MGMAVLAAVNLPVKMDHKQTTHQSIKVGEF